MTINARTSTEPTSGIHDLTCVWVCRTGRERGVYTSEWIEGGENFYPKTTDHYCLIEHSCSVCDIKEGEAERA